MAKRLNVRYSSKDLYDAAMAITREETPDHLAVMLHWAGDRMAAYENLLEKLLDTNLQNELEIAQDRLYELRDEFIRKHFKDFAPPVTTEVKLPKIKSKSKQAKEVQEKLQALVDAIHTKPDREEDYQWKNALFVKPVAHFQGSEPEK